MPTSVLASRTQYILFRWRLATLKDVISMLLGRVYAGIAVYKRTVRIPGVFARK